MVLKFNEVAGLRSQVAAKRDEVAAAENVVVEVCTRLHQLRFEVGCTIVGDVETFINSVANHPKEYSRTIGTYQLKSKQFKKDGLDFAEYVGKKLHEAKLESGATSGLGVAAGAATAFGAPTAAMAVATTFGTASTGAAISALSGAAATNAALAWLGGGALAAGGGGMAAGNALLALAGPAGWALAGMSLVAGAGWAAYKNNATKEDSLKLLEALEAERSNVEVKSQQVSQLYGLTVTHTDALRTLLNELTAAAPKSYAEFTAQQKELLGALHNNVLALGNLLSLKPGDTADLGAALEPLVGQPSSSTSGDAPTIDEPVVEGELTVDSFHPAAVALARLVGDVETALAHHQASKASGKRSADTK